MGRPGTGVAMKRRRLIVAGILAANEAYEKTAAKRKEREWQMWWDVGRKDGEEERRMLAEKETGS